MAYRYDPDLDFLSEVSSKDLDILVAYLTRETEELTESDEYKTHYPNHAEYWDLIAATLQSIGASSFMTFFRGGKGVLYEEIITDICDKINVWYGKNTSVEYKEEKLLLKFIEDALFEMSEDELQQVVKVLNINTDETTPYAITTALTEEISTSGLLTYQIALVVANSFAEIVDRELSITSTAKLSRIMAVFSNRIDQLIARLWASKDSEFTVHHVLLPAVIQVAFLRAQYNYGDEVEVDETSDSAPVDVKESLQSVISEASKNCPDCGARLPEIAAKFCMECGAKLHRENKCPECSTMMPDGAKFCSECGTKL